MAIGAVQLCAFLDRHSQVHVLVSAWMEGALAALAALGLGMCTVAAIGAVRLLARARPGDVRDPLRRLAKVLVPYRAVVLASLAGFALAAAVGSFVFPAVAPAARVATFGLLFFFARARHLRWFAGIRHATEGRVRFTGPRHQPFTSFFAGGILFMCSLAMLNVIGPWAIALHLAVVLGWFGWTLPERYVIVGVDGVEVAYLAHSTLHRFDREGHTRVEIQGDRIRLVRRGRRRPLSLLYGPMSEEDRGLLAYRLQELGRKAAARGAADPAELAATLASLENGAGYRVAEVPRETLWRVIETPDVAPPVRLRVAELLADEPHEGEMLRLREIADHLADAGTADALARIASSAR